MPPDPLDNGDPQANPGYAAWQMARALATCENHPDAATRERACGKAERWTRVMEGMLSGSLAVGSRQPMADIPTWATPEVVTGGFATGGLPAGGPLQPHEIELATLIGVDATAEHRAALNAWFLTEPGLRELTGRLETGCYEIQTPEEAALPAVAWLAHHGDAEAARELLDAISPHFARLRFYPKPTDHPSPVGPRIFLESVGTVLGRLQSLPPNQKILTQYESIRIWQPHYVNMVDLFLETVSGKTPIIQPDADGRWMCPETRKFHVTGGWPCQHYPDGWRERARATVEAIQRERRKHPKFRRLDDAGDSHARLLAILYKCCDDPASLSGRDVGLVRLILARHITRWGRPGSPEHAAAAGRQLAQTAKPFHHHIAGVVANRLSRFPAEQGLTEPMEVLQPVTPEEGGATGVTPATTIPPSIIHKVNRCRSDTPESLVQHRIVTSGETLARLIPQISANVRAATFQAPHLGSLYAASYRAFRRRRSLLLLNLEKQIQLEELPWIAAIERHRGQAPTVRNHARQTLEQIASIVLIEFPQDLLPNKLLQEFSALAESAGLDLPFVKELALDIFMDDFSPKFTRAAKLAAAYVKGTLYDRYFGLDCDAVLQIPDQSPRSWHWPWSQKPKRENPFTTLCIRRANVVGNDRWDYDRSGMIIEQSQILTTHNLAHLFGPLGLEDHLKPRLRNLAESCFRWICQSQQMKFPEMHLNCAMITRTAYAWRQMVFFLSRLPHEEVGAFIIWAEGTLIEQSEKFQTRFAPALRGLAAAHHSQTVDAPPAARRFLGCSQTTHWLIDEESPN